ncbi:MAG: hypothetical protein HYX68_04635, partial [Planctomycetes bacterium]|nr:hypothetical protein [Planctomycetota bacterium]
RPQDRQFRVTVAIATEETATTPSTVVWPFVKWPKLGDRQLTVRELLERDGYFVYFNERHLAKESRIVPLSIQTLNLPKGVGRLGSELKFDPRIIAISTTAFFHYYHLKIATVIGRADRSPPQIQKVTWNKQEAWEVSYKTKGNGALIRTVYVPQMGYCIVRSELEVTFPKSKETVRRVMEAKPKLWGGGHWFPELVSLQGFVNSQLKEKFTLEILEASFNRPISPNVFKMVGMDIPVGTSVNNLMPESGGRRYYWDGQKIVLEDRKGRETYQDKPPPGSESTWGSWLYAGSIACAVLAAGFLGFYFYNRMKTKG